VSFSVISISEDTNSEVFDPRNVGKYTYRIPVAPLVSFAIIPSLNVLGITITSSGSGGGGRCVIDFVKPNLFLLVVLSFLLGFFSKRSIEILDVVWKRLFDWDKTTKDAGADATTPKKPKKENGSRPKTATNSQGGSGPQKDTSGRSPVLSQAYTKSPEGSFEGTSPRRGTTQGESDLKPGLQDKSSESSPGFDTAHIDASDASETDDLVWYVAYGSNLLKKPLKLYLEGGAPSPNARVHRECPWGTEVQGDQAYKLGFELYFACKSSETWGKGGVAFVETKNVTPPPTLGRAYLLTIQQLGHVAMEENGWTDPVTIRKPDLSARSLVLLRETGRYRVLLPCRFLGKIPVVTLTGVPEETKPRNLPSEDYLNTIRKGLHETYLAMTELEIDEYLSRKLDPSLVAKVWSR